MVESTSRWKTEHVYYQKLVNLEGTENLSLSMFYFYFLNFDVWSTLGLKLDTLNTECDIEIDADEQKNGKKLIKKTFRLL